MPAQNQAAKAQKPQPKISLVIALLIGFGLLVLDAIDLIPFAGDFTNILRLGINFYLYSIGVSGVIFLIGEMLKFVPFVQFLPTDLVAWIATVLFEWFAPTKIKEKTEQAGEAMQGGKGAEAGAGAGAGGPAAVQEGETVAAQGEGAAGGEGQKGGENSIEGLEAIEERQEAQEEGRESGEDNKEGGEDTEEGDSELEREMETGAERSPEDEAKERDFDLANGETGSDSEEEEEDESAQREAAHNRAVQSGKVIEMSSPKKGRDTQSAAPEVPLPNIDEVPRPKKNVA